jgi:predicted nucleic acid-binding protein
MNKALLDTDALSEILKGKNQNITRRSTEYLGQFERLTISTIMVMEIVKGFQKVGRENKLQQFLGGLAALEVLPLTTEVAVAAGRIYGDSRIGSGLDQELLHSRMMSAHDRVKGAFPGLPAVLIVPSGAQPTDILL